MARRTIQARDGGRAASWTSLRRSARDLGASRARQPAGGRGAAGLGGALQRASAPGAVPDINGVRRRAARS